MRWFDGEPKLVSVRMVPVEKHWPCPQPNCTGEMKYAGSSWACNPPGYHHRCDKCGFEAALHGVYYPRVVFEPDPVVTCDSSPGVTDGKG